jgi:hypothetical protein
MAHRLLTPVPVSASAGPLAETSTLCRCEGSVNFFVDHCPEPAAKRIYEESAE